MATGLEVIEYYGISRERAMDFIMANVNHPEVIYDVASTYGITTQHLSDITGYSTDIIKNYFESSRLSTTVLDEVKLLFNSSLGHLDYLVNFNNHTGSLSTASLSEQVTASLDDPTQFDALFESIFGYEEADGLYTPDETGISHLGNIKAVPESLESIFFGTLINIINSLDIDELKQIASFPSITKDNLNDFIALVSDSLSDMPATPYPDSFLQENVVKDAVTLIEDYWSSDSQVIGILDDSPFLGLVIA
ncbi:MAG: hypothetical protein LZF85_03620 [Nitrosomonas sp.]|uniref:hypothetical protein n=1 Tax=Nitrosomonas sp. TaxID=42353 RepID=UPI0025CC03C7|nr:hypothetical protein [Nitrosomonas sp.]UJP03553.1 MAG: hypothetical protein LZF85_03620 [Nitrosomonas sp.]